MKKGSKLASIVTGAALVVAPTISGYAQAPQESVMPLKGSTYVSTNVVPVKNLKKTIDYQTLKPVEELQEETVSYMDRNEGIQMGYAYVPSEDKLYDKPSSEKIIEYQMENTTSFYGDQYLNPFIQPHLKNHGEFHLDYYGSGDVNNDTIIDWTDYNQMSSTPTYRRDVNRSGVYTDTGTETINGVVYPNDKEMLHQYLTDQIPYLPSHFDFLQTRAEKEFWSKTFTNIDSLHYQSWNICTDASLTGQIDASGVEYIENSGINFSVIDTSKNCLHNGPYYQVSTVTSGGIAHAINAILVGTNPEDFSDWEFREPQNSQIVTPGSPSMGVNSFANISKQVYFWSNQFNQYFYNMNMVINFDLNNGNATVISQDPDLVTSKPDSLNHIHPGGSTPAGPLDLEYSTDPGLTNPEVVCPVTGNEPWTEVVYEQSSNQTGTPQDSIYYNYDVLTGVKVNSLESAIIDSTLRSLDGTHFPNRTPHVTRVRDTEDPTPTSVYNGDPMAYSVYGSSGIPASQFTDNSGVVNQNRTITTTQGTNPDSCDYYEFVVNVADSAWDPTGNDTVINFSFPTYLDDSYFTDFPGPAQTEYVDTITPDMTGGLPGAANPTGVPVYVNQNPDKINNTQNPDPTKKEHYWYNFDWNHNASDSVCVNPIFQNQSVMVVETNPPYWTSVPSDTLVEEGTNLHPDNLGWSVAADSITPVTPIVTYEDELIEEIPEVQRLWERHWYAEDLSGTNASDTSTFITEDLTTGIRRNLGSLEKKLNFYPNPTSGIFKMKYQAEQPSRVAAEIYDATGRLVDNSIDTYLPGESELEFDISDKAPGLYFLLVFIDRECVFKEKTVKH